MPQAERKTAPESDEAAGAVPKGEGVRFGCKPDGFEKNVMRLYGTEYPKQNDSERYNFLSALDFPSAYREEFAQLMTAFGALCGTDAALAFKEALPRIFKILHQRTEELYIPKSSECLADAQKRIATDFLVNATQKPENLLGRRAYEFFGFRAEDSQKTVREKDGYQGVLLSRNPYIVNLRGPGNVINNTEIQALKDEINDFGRNDKDFGQRRTGRMGAIAEGGVDTAVAKKIYAAIPEPIRGSFARNLFVTSGYYENFDVNGGEDLGLSAHPDTFYAPKTWSRTVLTYVRERKDFGRIPPFSFVPNREIYLSTALYYLEHPPKGFEFMLSTISDVDRPGRSLEVSPRPGDLLIMDNVKTYPYAQTRDIILPATAAIHEVKEGSGDKSFLALFTVA